MATIEEKISECVQRLTEHLNVECACAVTINADEGGSVVSVALQAPEHGKLLIGKNGQNLQALEHVLRVMLVHHEPNIRTVSVDINDYRKTKIQELTEMVAHTARRVRDTQRSEALPPMTSYERRIVHTELASWTDLSTESVGQDPQRRVVIKPL